jgi:hypothetical protein
MFARQQLEQATEKRRFLCCPSRDVICRPVGDDQLRVDSWSKVLVVRQSPAGKNVSPEAEDIVKIRHQATSEDTKDFMCAMVTVIFGVCNSDCRSYLRFGCVSVQQIQIQSKPCL